MQAGSSGGFKADINVTPLVDVVLVLLIIFMVVTPMLQKSRAVDLPEASHVETDDEARKRLAVTMNIEGQLFVDSYEVPKHRLIDELQARLAREPSLELLVKGDRALTYGDVRSIMHECRKAGAKRVVLATREKSR